jgi:hypothetical protein
MPLDHIVPKIDVIDSGDLFALEIGPSIHCHRAVESDAPPVFFALTVIETWDVRDDDDAIIGAASG